MDKFAVDLDQVLNDFEYSELTDQYNAVRNTSVTTHVTNDVSLHSINNVFHSLNEYLNTNIDLTDQSQVTKTSRESADVSQHIDTFIGEPGRGITQKFDSNENDIPYEGKHDVEVLGVQVTPYTGNISEQQSDKAVPDILEYSPNEENIKKDEHNIVDFFDSDKKQSHTYDESLSEKESNYGNESDPKGSMIHGDLEIKEAELVNDKIEENGKIVEKISIENTDFDVKYSQAEVKDLNEMKQTYSENNEDSSNMVGFVDELNLDDSTINRLLDELEDEFENEDACDDKTDHITYEDNVVVDVKADKTSFSNTSDSSLTIQEDDDIDNLSESENVETTDIIDEDNVVIDDGIEESVTLTVPQPLSEISVLKIDEETETNVTKNDEDSKTDVSTLEVPNDGIQDSDSTIQIEAADAAINQIDNDTDGQQEIEESVETTSRPQNLSLKPMDEDTHREINLIGNPGSTPYNNIYVREEIHKHGTNRDSDGSSSSDTFSDASSTASTASTEEVKDEHDLHLDGCIKTAASALDPVGDVEKPTEHSRIADDLQSCSDEEIVHADDQETDRGVRSDLTEEAMEGPDSESVTLTCASASVDYMLENMENQWIGKRAPLWIPDSDATSCLHCDMKFTVLKRRHHCRACGLVLCSKCCHLRFKLDYLDAEARVCNKCHDILNRDSNSSSSSDRSPDNGNSPLHRPNPNNPSEYCSTVSPLEQAAGGNVNPPAVMVPIGVLKRKGSNKGKSNKSVMFCDGIRPGSDLTNLDNDFNYNNTKTKKLEKNNTSAGKINRNLPIIDSETNTFIPKNENSLPPIVTVSKTDITYTDCSNSPTTIEMLKSVGVTFALQLSLYVHVKIIDMSCCVNKMAWCFSTEGLINAGQDEIVYLLEFIDEESFVPKDLFYHINNIYVDAVKGTSVKELGLSLHNSTNFLDSKNHAGFLYIRPSFQCLENVITPNDPFLIGILIHRWETPWAKLFPLRLILRLGAEYRYYPSPIISSRHRDSVFVEVGHTIINLLADFRNYSYSLPQIRGLTIHMEDKNTTVTIPMNRYDQVLKSLNNTSDHILAFAGTFSQLADSHLVCIQDTQGNDNSYSTHAINIQNKPRKITGASFIVFNGALKSSSGLTAKSNIVEDGLMIQVLPEHMQQIRDKLRAMKNHTISCGCVNAESDESVNIVWGENDASFNIGVLSTIDNMPLSGIPSIRVHNGKNHVCVNGNRIIRWTEVFIIQNGEENAKNQDPVDVSKVSETIAKATCDALVKYLDLLLTNNSQKIGIRATLQSDDVSYLAGSNGVKLPPIYMKSLDNELIPVLHRLSSSNLRSGAIVLELIFRILNV